MRKPVFFEQEQGSWNLLLRHELAKRDGAVFVRAAAMLCVGCPIGPLHEVGHAYGEHSIDEEEFRHELRLAIGERLDADAQPCPAWPSARDISLCGATMVTC